MEKQVKKAILALLFCTAALLSGCKSNEVKAVEVQISQIGEVEESSGEMLEITRAAYDALPEDDQGKVSNYSLLQQAEEAYDSILIHDVETVIERIGAVDLQSSERIRAAREAYDELTKARQENVSNYETLIEAEARYDELVYDHAKTAVSALKEITAEDIGTIEDAEKAFADLSDEQKRKLEKELGSFSSLLAAARTQYTEKLIARINYPNAVEPDKAQLGFMIAAAEAFIDLPAQERNEIKNVGALEKALKNFKKYLDRREKTDKIYARKLYLDECEDIGYDILMKYPESYKGQKISMEVRIGAMKKGVFGGSLEAVTAEQGQPVLLTDKRGVKEPTLSEGDTLTVFGVYKGMKTIEVKEAGSGWFGSSLFEKTQETYDVPMIEFVYTSMDNLGIIATGNPGAKQIAVDQEAEEMKLRLTGLMESSGWKER